MASTAGILTSAPSEAAVVTCGLALAACVGVPAALEPVIAITVACTGLVSDPAEIWNAGDCYADVAGLVREASSTLGEVVQQYATPQNGWQEAGKDAFVQYRVMPYQTALGEFANMYDRVANALHALAPVYMSMGLASDALAGYACMLVDDLLLAGGFADPAELAAPALLNPVLVAVRAVVGAFARVAEFLADVLMTCIRAIPSLLASALSKGISAAKILAKAAIASPGWTLAGTVVAGVVAVGPLLLAQDFVDGISTYATGNPGNPPWPGQEQKISVRPEAIVSLGKHIDDEVGTLLTSAVRKTMDTDVGFPGFGAIGAGLGLAGRHTELRDTLADHLAAGWDTSLHEWLPGLHTTAQNWADAEQANVNDVLQAGEQH